MVLKTEKLSFAYTNSDANAINDINVDFQSNKIYLLLGASGCGKSSFANIIAGIIPNCISGDISGDILVDNISIRNKNLYEISQFIGYVMQDADTQFCTYRVEDELLFGMENLKYSREEMDKRIIEVMEIVGITHLRYRTLNSLSGGQKQKVAIASILILDPPIIILDEPTANLDPVTSQEIFKTIHDLKAKYKKTVIIIEHKLDYLMEYVDYVYIFDKQGYISDRGLPYDVFEKFISLEKSVSFHYPKILNIWRNLKLPYEDITFNLNETAEYLNNLYTCNNRTLCGSFDEKPSHFVKAEHISYSINGNKIINDLSFCIDKGDFLAVVGPNGAGKSTLAGILLNLHKNYKGIVNLEDKNVKSYNRKDLCQKAGLVFQNPEWQFVSYNVKEELQYSLRNMNLDKNKENELIESCLKRFNLSDLENSNPYLLSQGQKRRLSVATMLITGQELLVLDEPTYGQDYDSQTELLEYLRELNNSGVTIVMITHDMDAVIGYCNKVMVMKEGKSIYFGNNRDLFKDDVLLAEANLVKPIFTQIISLMGYDLNQCPINNREFISLLDRRKLS